MSERVSWQDADYAYGPAIAAWVRTRDLPHLEARDRELAMFWRTVRRWEEGGRASIDTIDRWLTFFGYHLSEVPDSVLVPGLGRRRVWQKGRSLRGRRIPDAIRRQALDAVASGEPPAAIALRLGVDESSIRMWRRKGEQVAA